MSDTAGVDDGAAFTGTSGNDTFKAGVVSSTGAAITTLNAGDVIDGGNGVDTLNLTATATNNNALVGTVKNIEKINITGSDFIDRTVSAQQLQTIQADQAAVVAAQGAVDAAQAAVTNAQAAVTADQAAVNTAVIAQGVLNAAANTAVAGIDAAGSIANVVNALAAAQNVDTAVQAAAIAAVNAVDTTGLTAAAALTAAISAEQGETAAAVTTAGDNLTAAQGTLTTAQGTLTTAQGTLTTAQATLAADQAVAGNATIDASFFQGSTDITVDGTATAVTNVTSQNVTFNGGAGLNDSVSYDAATTAGNVVVSNSRGAITLTGAKLATENVSGSVKAVNATTPGTLVLADGTVGGTIKTLNLNLSTDASVIVNGLTAAKTIDASASTGGLSIIGATATVATLNTGSGKDVVQLNTLTNDGSAPNSVAVNASVSTGAGDDQIYVNTTGTGSTTVSAGDGNDTITMNRALAITDKIDGGAGQDTLAIQGISLSLADYAVISAAVSNVETLKFQDAMVADASKLSQFTGFAVTTDASSITKLADAQSVTTTADVALTSAGYVAKDTGAATPVTATTYAGALHVTESGPALSGGANTITANAASIDLTVKATTVNTAAALTGDVQSATVHLVNAANSTTTPTADTFATFTLAGDTFALSNATGTAAGEGAFTNLGGLTSLTLTGNGSATVDNTNGALTTVDASALGGTLAYGANAGNVTGGLTYTANANVAETIKLGSGTDTVHIDSGSTVAKTDTISGFDAVKETNLGNSTTDIITFGGQTLNGAAANVLAAANKVTLTTAEQGNLTLAFEHAAAVSAAQAAVNDGVVTFQFGGDTYLFKDAGTSAGHADNTDLAVKIVGAVDFTTAFAVHA